MSNRGGGGRGRGGGRGGGRGRGGGQNVGRSQAQAIKKLEQVAANIENLLSEVSMSDGDNAGGSRRKNTRGSKSLMDLSGQQAPQWAAPGSHYHPPSPYPPQHQPQPAQGHIYQPQPPRPQNYQPFPQGTYFPETPTQGQYPPPPSYDETIRQHGASTQPPPLIDRKVFPKRDFSPMNKGEKKPFQQKAISPQLLVKTLVMFDGQMADSKTLSKQVESSPEEVEKVVKQRKDIFSHIKDGNKVMVELVPNVNLCSAYLSETGCTMRDTCRALHLCKNFILTRCDQRYGCPLGHRLNTDHNNSILSRMYLDLINSNNVLSVIRKVCRGNSSSPRVCNYYNSEEGCRKNDNCTFLHICKSYVLNDGKCSEKNCSYNHQLTNKQCKNVLTQYGVSTNESIRDTLLKIKSSLEKTSNYQSVPKEQKARSQKEEQKKKEDSSDSDASQTSFSSGAKKKTAKKNKEPKSETKSKPNNTTIKSTDLCGDVEIPEICVYSVNNKCINEKNGCKYLHAKSLFHWQVQEEKKWYNLRIFQSKILENAYRDVSKNTVMLPSIDTEKLNGEDQKILKVLGQNSWEANFREMKISNATKKKLTIRRVSTPSSATSTMPQATVYEWYFVDQQDKWIRYGHVDSLGKQEHICNISQEEIEKQYISNPSSTMLVTNSVYNYKIDFANMTQTNMTTNKIREIRRRPSRLSYQRTSSSADAGKSDASLPRHWQPMTPEQTHVLMKLDPNQPEFQEVSKGIKLMIPTAKILMVQRLQNQYLWRLFQYKKANLSQRYDELTMNVQKLYHGTACDAINSICKDNIDGRRYENTNDKYGKGTYFSNSSAVARSYCTPNAEGNLFMVQAEVIIGYVVLGNKSCKEPPPNRTTGYPYDTTVDNMTAPTVFVKYDKEEYYPEYIIEVSL